MQRGTSLSRSFLAAVALTIFAGCSASETGVSDTQEPPGGGGFGGNSTGGTSGSGASGSGGETSPTSGGTSGGSSTDLDALWRGFAKALCHHYETCVHDPYEGSLIKAMGDEDACATALEKSLRQEPHYAALNAAVRAGVLRVNTAVFDGCFAAASSCPYGMTTLPDYEIHYEDVSPCRELFEGNVPVGGNCYITEECAGESYCSTEPGLACGGKCVQRATKGQDCTGTRGCAGSTPTSWSFCLGQCFDVQMVETNDQLIPFEHLGCGFGNSYDTLYVCPDGYYCPVTGHIDQNGHVCAKSAPLGGACGQDVVCAEGRCESGTCKPYVIAKPGEPCNGASTACNALDGYTCPQNAADSPPKCVPATPQTLCPSGAWILEAPCKSWATAAPPGAPCKVHNDCESGICDAARGCAAGLCTAK